MSEAVAARLPSWFATADSSLGIWLDGGPAGRGFFGARPTEVIEGNDLELLDEVERRWRERPERIWMGWLTYDLGASALLGEPAPRGGLPGLCLRGYDTALELWPGEVRGHGDPEAVAELLAQVQGLVPLQPGAWPLQDLQARLSAQAYRSRAREALGYIAAGDTYQVNLSQPFFAPWIEHETSLAQRTARLYAALRRQSPATMGGLCSTEHGFIVSNSPETLLEVRPDPATGIDVARSWPIKGTRPRDVDPVRDAALQEELRHSGKDAAEHVMIVDLVRNDLGAVCRPGTVEASRVPQLVTLPTVHHLVTEVAGVLWPGWRLRELVEASFPGGSITGAPKRRTLQIIRELEQEPRGIYCGALVVLHPGGVRSSITIRTAVATLEGLALRSGGGLVIDSDPELERLETLTKTLAFAGPR